MQGLLSILPRLIGKHNVLHEGLQEPFEHQQSDKGCLTLRLQWANQHSLSLGIGHHLIWSQSSRSIEIIQGITKVVTGKGRWWLTAGLLSSVRITPNTTWMRSTTAWEYNLIMAANPSASTIQANWWNTRYPDDKLSIDINLVVSILMKLKSKLHLTGDWRIQITSYISSRCPSLSSYSLVSSNFFPKRFLKVLRPVALKCFAMPKLWKLSKKIGNCNRQREQ